MILIVIKSFSGLENCSLFIVYSVNALFTRAKWASTRRDWGKMRLWGAQDWVGLCAYSVLYWISDSFGWIHHPQQHHLHVANDIFQIKISKSKPNRGRLPENDGKLTKSYKSMVAKKGTEMERYGLEIRWMLKRKTEIFLERMNAQTDLFVFLPPTPRE